MGLRMRGVLLSIPCTLLLIEAQDWHDLRCLSRLLSRNCARASRRRPLVSKVRDKGVPTSTDLVNFAVLQARLLAPHSALNITEA
jgi:hypothetical protein